MKYFVTFILACILSLFLVQSVAIPENYKTNVTKITKIDTLKANINPVVLVSTENNNVFIEIIKTIITVLGGCITTVLIYLIDRYYKNKNDLKTNKINENEKFN